MPTEDAVCFTGEEYARHVREYWRGVAESDGFDSEEIRSPVVLTGLFHYDCQSGRRYPEPLLVKRYALLGLHRFNILQGTSFDLAALLKFNKTMNLTSSYYFTLLAYDTLLQKTFQVRVDERKYGSLDLTVAIARPKDDQNEAAETTKEPFVPHFCSSAVSDGVFQGPLPDWPSDDAMRYDKRLYELEKSEWEANNWISLYLELLILTTDRGLFGIEQTGLPQVQILRVVIETKDEHWLPRDKRLNDVRNAHVYITFKGLAKSPCLVEIGEHVERKAIIRRVIDDSGYLTLLGKFWSSEDTEQRSKTRRESGEKAQSSGKRPRLG